MSRQRLTMVALAGVGVIGATMFFPRKANPQNDVQERRNKAQDARDLGLGSAGVGGNKTTGGPSDSTTPSGPDKDPRYREVDTGDSKQYLPAGGVSTGRGGGGSTASASEKLGFKGSILGVAGAKTASRSDQEGYHDTRGISRMGSEVPSKKHSDVKE
ncbi:hypothetical protein TRIATDRAFT_84723 [Trichoderma atroviride IMI 206040]|uniref:Uncharacterized protein n=2 Tax=Hypocrea atroviridis TaxID=63577 RepID=G9P6Q4_HYPAI|nr:uncharacterized protein TRIATDRAFT_84723 [Trichoderma atroviride IMI 206040]EHK41474.1 hypothetical protein TRIATDRAFT_84723 [Trichoderma atroviride IMI 206040]